MFRARYAGSWTRTVPRRAAISDVGQRIDTVVTATEELGLAVLFALPCDAAAIAGTMNASLSAKTAGTGSTKSPIPCGVRTISRAMRITVRAIGTFVALGRAGQVTAAGNASLVSVACLAGVVVDAVRFRSTMLRVGQGVDASCAAANLARRALIFADPRNTGLGIVAALACIRPDAVLCRPTIETV